MAVPPDFNFDERPFLVIWETTQACDLACVHCRACAQPARNPLELNTGEAQRLIDEVAALEAPVFVLTGGDPLKRPDVYDLVEYATSKKVRTSLTPSATPLVTPDAIAEFKRRGLARLAISLDGPEAAIHDNFRRVPGSFDWTLRAVRWAHEVELPVQINTTITRHNLQYFDRMIALMHELDIVLWSVFFLVPTGRGSASDLISAEEFEQVFAKMYETSQHAAFDIKSTEAQHYRRYVLERRTEMKGALSHNRGAPHVSRSFGDVGSNLKPIFGGVTPDGVGRAPKGLNDGKGFVFISHQGDVFPSGFLPLKAGNIRQQSLTQIYRHSPLFAALRRTENLKGKCGVCEFREVCGGSRARAYALTGDPFAEEPCCVWQPKAAAAEVNCQRSNEPGLNCKAAR